MGPPRKGTPKRRSSAEGRPPVFMVNFVSLLITCTILFMALKLSDGNFATRINEISIDLNKALHEVMDSRESVDYTEIETNFTGVVPIVFNPMGMAGLYNFTNSFINLIITKNFSFDGLLVVKEDQVELGDVQSEWHTLVCRYAGLLTMCVILILAVVFFPLCGLCFCCCRCCGNCGARSQESDKRHDLCCKILLATLLICLGTILLFAVVCAFVSNQQIHGGVNELTDNTNTSLNGIKSFMNFTTEQFRTLFITNFGQFANNFRTQLNESSVIVYNQLTEFTDAVVMTNISNFADRLDEVKTGFNQIKHSTNVLRAYASQLNDATRQVKKDLLQTLKECDYTNYRTKCSEIQEQVARLNTNIDFNRLPDITNQIESFDQYGHQISQLHTKIKQANYSLMQVENKIKEPLNSTMKDVDREISTTNKTIIKYFNSMVSNIRGFQNEIDNLDPHLRTMDRYIVDYGKYQYYAGLAIACMLLVIALCIALGLMCGVCGKRPDVYGDDCCNKGTGSRFLICGVMLMFICGFVFSVIVVPFFLLGVGSQRIICDSIRNPNDSATLRLLDKLVSKGKTDFNLSFTQLLVDIDGNRSLYDTFQLANKFNLSTLDTYVDNFNDSLRNLSARMNEASDQMQKININGSVEILNQLKQLDIKVDFDRFKDELSQSFVTVNLTTIAEQLGNLIDQIQNTPSLSIPLQRSKLHIETYQEKLVEPMLQNATDLINLCQKLKEDLTFKNGSFQSEVTELANSLNGAQENLQNGTGILSKITQDFAYNMADQVKGYIGRVVNTTKFVVTTGPLSKIINGTLTSTCDKILLPFNGFWFGLFWSVIVFIPTIIVSVKLANLYQKFNPYSGNVIETEYLYDAYADRDSIPISRGKPAKKKKKSKRYEDRGIPPGAAGDLGMRDYPAGGSHQDARYADMAPKHWEDFPAGGPPQYQRAPTEYERPPPYYYPGTGDH